MSTAAVPLMTAEEMLALPDNGMDRDLIEGQLRERPTTRRNRRHSRTTSKLALYLEQWLGQQEKPRGEILTGDAGFRLRRDPDTTVGIDVACISAELAERTPREVFLIDGAPVLAVEILSPSDTHEELVEKVELYLDTGVMVVWIIDPDMRTVTVFRPDAKPVLYNESQELAGDPDLPGFQMKVADLFA